MIELVNLEEYVDYVVKVVRRDDRTLYGKIKSRPNEYNPFLFDLGGGGGVCYRKCGRVVVGKADGLDIIWIKKIAKEPEMTETIQQLKEDITLLQMKLQKLEEQDPEMLLLRQGKVDFVDYDGKKYFRIEYTDSFAGVYSWYVRKVGEDAIRPVRDVNVYAPLEELYQKEVVKQKDDYPYKKYTPEETAEGLRNAMRKAKKDGVFDEPTKPMNEVLDRLENKYKDAEENAASYMTDEVVNRMLKKWEENPPEFLKFELGKTLEGLISDWMDDCVPAYSTWDYELGIAILIRRIEKWLPDFQSAAGSQSLGVEDMVEGFNDALTKIKYKLRNKK